MIIAHRYSFNGGETYIKINYPILLEEVEAIIASIDASTCMLKKPKDKEINRANRVGITHFYSPSHLNALFDFHFFNPKAGLIPRCLRRVVFPKIRSRRVNWRNTPWLAAEIVNSRIFYSKLGYKAQNKDQ